ncbi:MAG TPA: tail fiber domain-containing protein, partial [Pyrinomonadaceae bacterium]
TIALGRSNGSDTVFVPGTLNAATINFNLLNGNSLTVNSLSGNSITGNTINAVNQYDLGGSRILAVAPGSNLFVGWESGAAQTTGFNNSFFGRYSGTATTTGFNNSFFGLKAGQVNTEGNSNAFFGDLAGGLNTTGANNAFFGSRAGGRNVTGSNNTFVGASTGGLNANGDNNTLIGANAKFASGDFSFATAIGAGAVVDSSNSIVLGRNNGADEVVVEGTLRLKVLTGTGTTPLCRTSALKIGSCASSLSGPKTDVQNFTSGLDVIRRLRPVSFTWQESGTRDLGFIGEEVARVEPLMTTKNEKGETETVKYDRVSVALVNAVNEQQKQIEQLKEQVETLKKLVCAHNPQAGICAEEGVKK